MQLLLSLIIIFLSIPAFGADPQNLVSYPQERIMGFRGLDTRSTAPSLQDGRAIDILNVKLSSAFDIRKRYGYDTVNDTLDDLDLSSPPITGIFDTEFSNSTSYTIAFVGNKIKYDNSGTWTAVGNWWDAPLITEGKNNQFQCIMALDTAVCTNDVDVVIEINSTPAKSALNVSNLTDTLTKVKTLTWYQNYLIFGNTVENSVERPTRFRWSNVGTTETYSNDDFIDISTFAGDEIIGFSELYGDLYIFLKNSIWKASLVGGDEVFILRKVIDGIGSIARDSIRLVQLSDNRTAVIFLDEHKKILMFNGVSVTDLGSIIQPTLDTLNASRLQYAVSLFDGQDYFLCASTSGASENDICFDFQIEIAEWTKHDQIDANAMARVKESTSIIKNYFGNYDAFVYWMDNPDLNNDIDGATGILDSVGNLNTSTITGAQFLVDSTLTTGNYTGAIIKITSGTGSAQEAVIVTQTSTGVAISASLLTTPNSTSVYSIGAIESNYNGKWYDMGSSSKEKTFLGLLLWAAEESSNEVTFSYAEDFNSVLNSETKSLAPSGSSLWDVALWDSGVWGTTGDKLFTFKVGGLGNFIQPRFSNDDIDETFHLYGFNLIGTVQDTKQ